jgi:chaperone required for assembly of F1-ATPase
VKRFYQTASATPDHGVALDGRPIKTPLKAALILPTAALAEAVAAEWQGQGAEINPASMILTKLANTAIDKTMRERDRIVGEIVDYAGSDLVCYRTADPVSLQVRQIAAWDPVLNWALAELDAAFVAVSGIVHQPQSAPALAAFRKRLEKETAWHVTAIHNLTTLTSSALIALMLARGAVSPETAWAAAHVDEDWQIEHWGEDDEAIARRAGRNAEFTACVRFISLATIPPAS